MGIDLYLVDDNRYSLDTSLGVNIDRFMGRSSFAIPDQPYRRYWRGRKSFQDHIFAAYSILGNGDIVFVSRWKYVRKFHGSVVSDPQ
jgi:hypothetical protein